MEIVTYILFGVISVLLVIYGWVIIREWNEVAKGFKKLSNEERKDE